MAAQAIASFPAGAKQHVEDKFTKRCIPTDAGLILALQSALHALGPNLGWQSFQTLVDVHKQLTNEADTCVVGVPKTKHLATKLEEEEFELLMKQTEGIRGNCEHSRAEGRLPRVASLLCSVEGQAWATHQSGTCNASYI